MTPDEIPAIAGIIIAGIAWLTLGLLVLTDR